MQVILGISAYFHDSAAALVVGGKIIAAAQEERFVREKNTTKFPINAIRYCLQEAKIGLKEIDAFVYYEKPFLKFERILETHYRNVPKGLFAFIKAMPKWTQKKLFVRRDIRKKLQTIDPSFQTNKRLYFSSHHLSHAASAFYPSPFEEAAIIVIDGVGEWSTVTIARGGPQGIELLKEMNFPDSIGLLYSSVTYFLGFEVDSGEYKLMGLAPYGDEHSIEFKVFVEKIKNELIQLFEDGSIEIKRKYFSYEYGLEMIDKKQWATLFGIAPRLPGQSFEQGHCNLALAIQRVVEEIVIRIARYTQRLTGSQHLCLAGGVALNCVANGKLYETGIFENIWVQPAAGDAGCAIGGALAFYYHYNPVAGSRVHDGKDEMQGSLLGPKIKQSEIAAFVERHNGKTLSFESKNERNHFIIQEISRGKVIGLMQGRMEFGPRALGARSIIANPKDPNMQRHLNLVIKEREDFRPFAPVMLREEAVKYYDCDHAADYMQFVRKLKAAFRKKLPDDYHQLSINEKLAVPRSQLQAVTHVDYSSRLQVVDDAINPLYDLLMEMRNQSGDAILINTSLNRNGEPIVCTMEDGYNLFLESNMDILVVEDHLFLKA